MFFQKQCGLPLTDGLQVKHSQQPVAENRGDFEDGNNKHQ